MGLFNFLSTSGNIKTVTPSEFKKIIADPKVQLVDVRTIDEYASGTIDQAILLDFTSPDFIKNARKKLDKSRPVAVFCRSGVRSMRAAQMLGKEGFPVIYNLKGGILAWK
jgi:rhodanese-related sulfurtransferase